MNLKNSLEVKLVKFSKAQLEAKLEKEQDEDVRQAIQNILDRRNGIKKEDQPKPDLPDPLKPKDESPIEEKTPKKEKSPKKEKTPKKVSSRIPEGFVPTVSSKDKDLQSKIDQLQTLNGQELEDLKSELELNAIDVQFISFLQKGDIVEFKAAKNSPMSGNSLEGVVTGTKDVDKFGRKFCKIKVEGKGSFQKLQSSVIRISNDDLA